METESVLFAGIVAIFIKKCSPELPFAIIIGCLGCLFLAQPEFIARHFEPKNVEYIDQINSSNFLQNLSLPENENFENKINETVNLNLNNSTGNSNENQDIIVTTDNYSWSTGNTKSNAISNNNDATTIALIIDTTSNSTPQNTEPEITSYNNPLYGYLCVTGLALCLCTHWQFNAAHLLQVTTVSPALFWIGLGCFVISIIIMFATENPTAVTKPLDITMVIVFACSSSLNMFLLNYSITLIPFSRVVLVLPTAMIMLYGCQKTFLKEIQPGAGNWLEILGMVLIIVGSLITPICEILRERKSKSVDLQKE